jgi:DNA-binding CsgD family transcriptional regulator
MEALDAFPTAVVLVDRSARVIHASRAAEALLRGNDGLYADRFGLHASGPAATAALRKLCADCAETTRGTGLSAGGGLSLPRPSGRRDLQLVVSPLSRAAPVVQHNARIAAIVFVSDPDGAGRSDLTLLQTLYGLTRAEAVVASHLATGKTLKEIAAVLRYTTETMRWYSKQLLSKVNCRTRSELVRLLSTTLAALDMRSDALGSNRA